MATFTDILRKEHEAILRMLDLTEEVARTFEGGGQVVPEALTGLQEFFQLFADRCHHSKEEELLFPRLVEKGLPAGSGPIGIMLLEHEQGRSLIKEMGEATQLFALGDRIAGARWAVAARSYATLLRQHILKENNVLFDIAEGLLTEAEHRDLVKASEKVEEEKMGVGTHDRLHALMDGLTSIILSPSSRRK